MQLSTGDNWYHAGAGTGCCLLRFHLFSIWLLYNMQVILGTKQGLVLVVAVVYYYIVYQCARAAGFIFPGL